MRTMIAKMIANKMIASAKPSSETSIAPPTTAGNPS
jgi:hypothetical protein